MEYPDRDLQQRVWQRVGNRELPMLTPGESIKAWILTAQENAAAYLCMSRQPGAKEKARLQRLYRESRQWIACLRGICRMEGEAVAVPQVVCHPEAGYRTLEKCYHRERKLWEEWERRSGESVHGPVYGKLARQAQEHCVTIMEMLGRGE